MRVFGAARVLGALEPLIIRGFRVHACHDLTPSIPPDTHLAEFKRTNDPFSPLYLIVTKT